MYLLFQVVSWSSNALHVVRSSSLTPLPVLIPSCAQHVPRKPAPWWGTALSNNPTLKTKTPLRLTPLPNPARGPWTHPPHQRARSLPARTMRGRTETCTGRDRRASMRLWRARCAVWGTGRGWVCWSTWRRSTKVTWRTLSAPAVTSCSSVRKNASTTGP